MPTLLERPQATARPSSFRTRLNGYRPGADTTGYEPETIHVGSLSAAEAPPRAPETPTPARILDAAAIEEAEMRRQDAAMAYFSAASLGTAFNPTTVAARYAYDDAARAYNAARERAYALRREALF